MANIRVANFKTRNEPNQLYLGRSKYTSTSLRVMSP